MFALNNFELYRDNLSGLHTDYKYRVLPEDVTLLLFTYRYALPFEKVLDPVEKTIYFQKNWSQTITVSIGYFFVVKLIQYFMKYRSAFNLRWPLFTWNLSLALFNILGFIRFAEASCYLFSTQLFLHPLYLCTFPHLIILPTVVACWCWSQIAYSSDSLYYHFSHSTFRI
ncbi:unnamed protein product [Brugia timori]|uniref:Elongation of very long chain fatty acids protein n=1 Tax=Brugia timori TaxID=42155 RepID=A0A0R3QCP6_9BILA|nr:unnamed protein product [Brugia timori]